ncbi:MAG: hypothetical protein JWL63_1662 [Rhodocyclales bacterium]|nr:hypothetical protein [Rhodocyclales bacterium]
MARVKKIPYHTMEPSILSKKVWKAHYGQQGCVPLNTQQTISLDRLAPGEPAPPAKPKPPKPTRKQIKAQQAEQARQQALAESAKKQEQKEPKNNEQKPKFLDAEECEKLPIFDLQDIPDAMQKMGWTVSAKLARRWFSSPKHVFDGKPTSLQPLDDSIITLDWTLKFGTVKNKFNKLISEDIYESGSIALLKKYTNRQLSKTFVEEDSTNLSFNTAPYLADIRQFHIDWQFQLSKITSWDTMDGLHPNDLTGSLANFNLYVAIGNVDIAAEKYFKYDKDKGTKSYCIDSVATVTHVYIYAKDNYSFIDEYSSSQYLGHWNKTGVIIAGDAIISEITNSKYINSELGNHKKIDFFDIIRGKDKPVDLRKGWIGKYKVPDVFFPVYNKDYNQWREKHNRGGDLMIYSKPKYLKLKKPIKIKLEAICRPPEKM